MTGAPGAGKSTLAAALAAELDLPVLMKDTIKEALADGLRADAWSLQESRRAGAAAYEVMWAVARHMPEVIIESNFRPDLDEVRRRILLLHSRPVEIYCRCPAEVAAARYNERHAQGERHPVHVLGQIGPGDVRVFGHPLGLGPVIEVDTTVPIDLASLARAVHASFATD